LQSPSGDEKLFTFKPVLGSFDLFAKASILNMHQFNGKNGCPICLHPGEWKHGSGITFQAQNISTEPIAPLKGQQLRLSSTTEL